MTKPVLVAQLLWSFEVGGAEMVALNIARGLDKSLFRIIACSLNETGPMEDRFNQCGIETYFLQGMGVFAGPHVTRSWQLHTILRRKRVAILHCHNSITLPYAALAARLAGIKVVVCTMHALGVSAPSRLLWLLERAAEPLTAHYVAVAKTVLRRGIGTGRIRKERASVIYNGVDTRLFKEDSKPRPRASDTTILGCVARLSHEKRHCTLIDAIRELADRGNSVFLYLVGDGPLRRELESQVLRLDLSAHVCFLGNRNDVPQLLPRFDVFVLPSSFEGMPLTVLEAMASGLPVIATNVGALSEMVEEGINGYLVPPDNPGALAIAIERLVRDKDLRTRMGRVSRKMAVERFDLSTAVRRHEELYLKLLARKGFRIERGK